MKVTLRMVLLMEKEIMRIQKKLILENGEMTLDMDLGKNSLRIEEGNMSEALPVIDMKERESYFINSLHIKVSLNLGYSLDKA
jgi:hypothetical protein